jgi:WXG100 family type VII secretion target
MTGIVAPGERYCGAHAPPSTGGRQWRRVKECDVAENISAEEGALARGAQAVVDARQGIDQRVAQVRREIETVGGMWTGPAATRFTQLMAEWDTKTKKLNGVLEQLEASLTGTARDQQATDEQTQQTISGLNSMMGA